MKLFGQTDKIKPNLSVENFREYYANANTISEEALSDYLYKIKDMLSTTYDRINGNTNDKITIDTVSTKYEVLNKLKRIKFTEIKDIFTSKPENFRGKYIDYVSDLINVSSEIASNTEFTLDNLKLAIAGFINEYSEDKIITLYGSSYFTNAEKLTEKHKKEITKYFPDNNSSTKAYVSDLLKTTNDIDSIYKFIVTLDETLNYDKLMKISKLTNDCVLLLENIIEQQAKSNILSKTDSVKKDLIRAIHITATEVEFLSYLYSNIVMFYGTFRNLTKDITVAVDKFEDK